MKLKVLCFTFFAFFNLVVFSQQVTFSGNIYGFLGERVLLIKKASKNVSFEGPIGGAKLIIKSENNSFNIYSDITGSFSFVLPKPSKYDIEITSEEYSTVQVTINYEEAGEKTNYLGTSFILKKGDNSINNLGDITISNSGVLKYTFNTSVQKKSSGDVQQSNKMLIEKAVAINNTSKKNIGKLSSSLNNFKNNNAKNAATPVVSKVDTAAINVGKSIQSTLNDLLKDSLMPINDVKSKIEEAKKALALISPESEHYELLLAQIKNAENQIKAKELLIKTQQSEISNSKKKIIYLVLFCVFAIISILLLLNFLNSKKKHNLILAEKNKNINKINARLLSGIRYASIVQSSFFKEKALLKKLFPDSFLFNQPKDYLSGDFYWFSHIHNHKIIAVADCTGHGVPGALLSILGHNILENIVNVQGIVLPSKILFELNKGIVAAFSNDTQVEYGIDITIISIPDGSNELLFSGITNGLYQFSNNKIVHHKVTAKTISPLMRAEDLENQSLSIKKGDCFYLLSDGYCDQFGGKTNAIEKYNLKRMDDLLNKISSSSTFSKSESVLESEFTDWKGAKEQTDDVLVLGFKI